MTPRQRECARLLVNGHSTDAALGKAMGISPTSMRKYMAGLFNATGMGSRLELALFIVRHPQLERLLHHGPDYERTRRSKYDGPGR